MSCRGIVFVIFLVAVRAYVPFSDTTQLYTGSKVVILDGMELSFSAQTLTITHPSPVTNPSLCLCLNKLAAKHKSGDSMKFYVFPTSLTSTGFTIQVYVHLNTILTGSSIGYLVFDKTAALVDTFLLGSSYLVASTINLSINSTKYEQVVATAPVVYSHLPESRLAGYSDPPIECMAFFLGENMDFIEVSSATPYDYWLKPTCRQEYESNQITIGVQISNGIILNQIRVSVLTFIRREGPNFSLFYNELFIDYKDIDRTASSVSQFYSIVPQSNGSKLFGLSKISVDNASNWYTFDSQTLLTVANDGSTISSTAHFIFWADSGCATSFDAFNGVCSDNKIVLQQIENIDTVCDIRMDSGIIGLLDTTTQSLKLVQFTDNISLLQLQSAASITVTEIQSSRILAIDGINEWLLSQSAVIDLKTDTILYQLPSDPQRVFADGQALSLETSYLNQTFLGGGFLLIASNCQILVYSRWSQISSGSLADSFDVLGVISSLSSCGDLSIFSTVSSVTNINETDISIGISLDVQILEPQTSKLSIVNLTIEYSYQISPPVLQLSQSNIQEIYSAQLLPGSTIISSTTNPFTLTRLPATTTQYEYQATPSFYKKRQPYIYLMTNLGSLHIFTTPNPSTNQTASYDYQQVSLSKNDSNSLFWMENGGSDALLMNTQAHIVSTADGVVAVAATDTNLLYYYVLQGSSYELKDIVDVGYQLNAGTSLSAVKISQSGNQIMVSSTDGSTFFVQKQNRVYSNQPDYVAISIQIQIPPSNDPSGSDVNQNKSHGSQIILIIGIAAGGGVVVLLTLAIIIYKMDKAPRTGKKQRVEPDHTRMDIISSSNQQIPNSLVEFSTSETKLKKHHQAMSSRKTIIVEDIE